jgi:hypothetical protein
MVREGDVWTFRADTTFRLRDSRGLGIVSRLVLHPGPEFHATDLLAPSGEAGHVEDAGEVLDSQAIAAYKRRLEELRDIEDEATKNNDTLRATRVRQEIEALAGGSPEGARWHGANSLRVADRRDGGIQVH